MTYIKTESFTTTLVGILIEQLMNSCQINIYSITRKKTYHRYQYHKDLSGLGMKFIKDLNPALYFFLFSL